MAGNGVRGTDAVGGKALLDQELSSPWDIVKLGDLDKDEYLIAMSGIHQIWHLDLAESGQSIKAWSGNSVEGNLNHSDPKECTWAQPSGISFDDDQSRLFVADSESSAI